MAKPQLRNYANEVLAVLAKGPCTRNEVAQETGLLREIVVSSLLYLQSRKLVQENDDRWSVVE